MIISYLGCQKDINPVSYNPNGTKSLKYSGIFINNDKELIFKESGDKCTKTIFVCDDSAIIKHFDYSQRTKEKASSFIHSHAPHTAFLCTPPPPHTTRSIKFETPDPTIINNPTLSRNNNCSETSL